MSVTAVQLSLLEPEAAMPAGFAYRPALLTEPEEAALIARLSELPFREFEFHGYLGKRRVVSFGLRYDFADREVHRVEAIPGFLLPLRDRAAAFAGIAPAALEHALVTEYRPGAAIGWHRDRPVFGDVIGISFVSPCRFRFRRVNPHPNPPPLAGEGTQPLRVLRPPPQAGKGGVGVIGRTAWERLAIMLEPRSAYLLRSVARSEWEHSIPPAEALRYSVTFRTMLTP